MSTKASTMALSATHVVAWNDPAPSGATLGKVFIGPDPDGLGGFQIATAAVVSTPTRALLDKLYTLRKGNRAISLVVAATDGTRTWLHGPDPQTATIELPYAQAARCQWPIRTAHGWPAEVPAGGHENCPLMANRSAHLGFGGVGHARSCSV